jgi:hypothetical protein
VLLLVLILILIAFGLLVVALLTGSVVWAWVSVAVSAVAALVLVVDHLQRRAAVRAGRAGAESEGSAVVGALEPDPVELEPVTEILPALQPTGDDPGGQDHDVDHGFDQHRGGDQHAERLSGADQGHGGQQTVSMQGYGPPGSDGQPSGAATASLPPPGASSHSVTTAGGGAAPAASTAPPERSLNQPTVAVSPADLEPDGAREGGVRPSDPTVHGVSPADVPPVAEEPVADDVEPPEESRDQSVAALVAQLADEVVVVDEQPRYHMSSCRALAGRAVIPIPVQEAVELGFTPCGWCSPDHTLAERHPARAQ